MTWTDEQLEAMWDREMEPYHAPSLTGEALQRALAKLDAFLRGELPASHPTKVSEFTFPLPEEEPTE